jgi:hypothetical protein
MTRYTFYSDAGYQDLQGEWVKAEEADAELEKLDNLLHSAHIALSEANAEIEALKNAQEWRNDWDYVQNYNVAILLVQDGGGSLSLYEHITIEELEEINIENCTFKIIQP